MNKYGFPADQVCNADVTVLYWKCLTKEMRAKTEEKSATCFKLNKIKLTCLTSAMHQVNTNSSFLYVTNPGKRGH